MDVDATSQDPPFITQCVPDTSKDQLCRWTESADTRTLNLFLGSSSV